MKTVRAAAAGLLLLAAGCTVGTNYRKPDLPVPAAWKAPRDGEVDARSTDLARWWKSFDDPLLDSLVVRAIESNLDLRIAEARIREARALRAFAAGGAWPAVDVSGSYTRSRTSENAFQADSQGGGGASGSFGGEARSLYRAGFDASWEIDIFGGVRRSVEAADAAVEASVESRRDALVTLLGDVARNYIELRGFQRRLDVGRANLKAQQETLYLTKIRFDAGLSSDLDVARAEAQVQSTASQIPALESALMQAAHGLDALLGLAPGSLGLELSKEAPVPALPSEVLVGVPSDLLRRRPDIRRAERRLAEATAQTGAAMADLFPRFFLIGAAGLQSAGASDWFTAGSRFWSIGPSVRWPLFDAGRIRANIEVRSAQQEQALAQYEKSILGALADVENALIAYAKEQARHQALVDGVTANRRAVEMANELHRAGLSAFLDVLDAERSLFLLESDLVQSEAAMASNLVALYKALGGGWD